MSTTTWVLDPTHSEVQFKIKHLMITNVTGSFNSFEVNATADDENFTMGSVSFKAAVNSISTNNPQRDGHLVSGDFFDAENFPSITFNSNKVENITGDGSFDIVGDLTIKNITKQVKFVVEFGGVTVDPYANTKAGFTVSGKINRTDFGLIWNASLESGGVLLSEEVKIMCEIQLVKQK